jgi:outer membrane autotransporter protein
VSYNQAFASYITPKVSYTGTDAYLSLTAKPAAFNTAQGVAVDGFTTVNSLFDTQNALLSVQGGTAGGILKVNGQPDPGVWVRGLRGFGGAYGAALSDHAVLVGGGSEVRPGLILGAAVANTQTRTQSSQQKVDTHTTGLSGYGLYNRGPLVLGASVSAGRIDTSSYRTLQPTGLDASGSAGGWYAGLAAKAGWRLRKGIGFLVPSLSAAYLHTRRDAYSESGGGTLDLTYGAATYDIGALRAGVRTGIDWRPRAALTVSPWLGLGAVAYVGNRDQGLPVTLGTTQESLPATAAPDKAALVDAGVALMSRGNWSGQLVYHGQFSDHTHMNTADLKVVYRW